MMNPKLKAVHVRISNEKESEDCLDVHFVVLRHTIRLSTGYVVLASWNKEVIYIYIYMIFISLKILLRQLGNRLQNMITCWSTHKLRKIDEFLFSNVIFKWCVILSWNDDIFFKMIDHIMTYYLRTNFF